MKWVNLLFITLLIFLYFPVSVEASISKINFTTEPQSIGVNSLSEAITIQVQDSSGNPFETIETLDLVFTSTSGTGEFLGSTGNAVTKTMNRNTANRTFYYRDSVSGTFTITVTATGRDSGKQWSASQKISVGTGGNSGGEVLGASTVASSGSSATTGSAPISKTTLNSTFEIYGGADRLTSVGSPINFQVLVKKGDSSAKVDFSWSFGDGSVGSGAEPVHTYKYPGTYAVVVSAKFGKNSALSRLKVTVVEPKLKVIVMEDCVEITNEGGDEINLFNWKLVSGIKNFIFQPDTILFPQTSVCFDNNLLKFSAHQNGGVSLFDSLNKNVTEASSVSQFEELGKRMEEIQRQIVSLGEVSRGDSSEDSVSEESPRGIENTAAAALSSASSSVVLYEALPEKKSWLMRLFDFLSGSE